MDAGAQLLVSVVSGVFVAAVASAVTAHFAFRRFYSERWWERKAAAYTDAIEMLYSLNDYPNTLFEAEVAILEAELTQDQLKALEGEYRGAVDRLNKTITLGSFTLSERAIAILTRLRESRREVLREWDWPGAWLEEANAVYGTIQEFLEEARRDLKVDHGWFGDG